MVSLNLTADLKRWGLGDTDAERRVLPRIYAELRKIATHQIRRERSQTTFQATDVVHEAFMRLHGQEGFVWPSRRHFYAFAAHLMRRILVERARVRNRLKRGGNAIRVDIDEAEDVHDHRFLEILELNDAITRLGQFDPLKARIVELRAFGGFSIQEIAAETGFSEETIGRHWKRAKAWLHSALRADSTRRGDPT
ncbi:MAG TPA: ECF-type sigma factor [Thermoanaerobaculia bacterium]|nr:ECF-type sigma factor [Thermoanaerobaculia bacterium]